MESHSLVSWKLCTNCTREVMLWPGRFVILPPCLPLSAYREILGQLWTTMRQQALQHLFGEPESHAGKIPNSSTTAQEAN